MKLTPVIDSASSAGSTSSIRADSLWELLERRVQMSAARPMLIEAESGRQVSFAAFRDEVESAAGWLHACGVGQHSKVAWQIPTRIAAATLTFALARLGATQAPIIHLYRERELGEVLAQFRPSHVFVAPAQPGNDYPAMMQSAIAAQTECSAQLFVLEAQLFASRPVLPVFIPAGDVVRWCYFTSGTTSRPKGVLHTDRSLMTAGCSMGDRLAVSADDVGTIGYPYAHIGGIIYTSMLLGAGMSAVLFEKYIPAEVATAFARHSVTFGGGSTAHYQALLTEQRKQPDTPLAPSLKVLAGGGAAKPTALYYLVKEELRCKIVHAYGMTEAPITSSNAPSDSDEQLANTDGAPLPAMEIRIRRADGSPASQGESGEIWLRGPHLCRGYLDAEQTRTAFDADGFLSTGDIGLLRSDGHLCVTGRTKDVIIRKGENVSAREIEELLLSHPKVKDVAVIGLPDEERGEKVCAVVESTNESTPLGFAEMVEYLKSKQLMRQKIPEQLEVFAELPRNQALQKVMKQQIRAELIRKMNALASSTTLDAADKTI